MTSSRRTSTPEELLAQSDSLAEGALNRRALSALDGEFADPSTAIIELLASDVPVSREVRDALVRSLSESAPTSTLQGGVVSAALERAGESELPIPHLAFARKGGAALDGKGEKSFGGMIDRRRDYLDLARQYRQSNLGFQQFLDSGRHGLDSRQRNKLAAAVKFAECFERWRASEWAEYPSVWVDADDLTFALEKRFCEWVVERNLLIPQQLSDFLLPSAPTA